MKRCSKLLRVLTLLSVIAGVLLPVSMVKADTDNPSPDPQVIQIDVYRNLIETGDRLYLIYANIPYTVIPVTPVTDTFIWRLFDTDNVTLLGTTVGTNFNDAGYGFNVYSMYFSAAENLTYEATYVIRLSGNPTVFDSPPEYNFPVSVGDYTSENTTLTAQAALSDRILILAKTLDDRWGLTPISTLLSELETTTILSINGQAFFRGAINGIQSMAPALFEIEVLAVTAVDRTWNLQYSENLTNQWSGTWVETAIEGNKALFGLDYDLVSIILLFVAGVALLVGNMSLTGNAWSGLMDASVLMVMAAKLGLYALGFLGLVVAVAFTYIGLRTFRVTR